MLWVFLLLGKAKVGEDTEDNLNIKGGSLKLKQIFFILFLIVVPISIGYEVVTYDDFTQGNTNIYATNCYTKTDNTNNEAVNLISRSDYIDNSLEFRDNWYCYYKRDFSSKNFTYNIIDSNTLEVKTGNHTSPASNSFLFATYILGQNTMLNKDTIISYSGNTSDPNKNYVLSFMNDLGHDIILLQLTTGSGCLAGLNCSNYCSYNETYGVTTGNLQYKEFTLRDVADTCSYVNNLTYNIQDIRMVSIKTGWTGLDPEYLNLDNFNITFHINELPSFNYTINASNCFNDSTEQLVYNLDINAVDPENDDIYYAVTRGKEVNYSKFVTYGTFSCVSVLGQQLDFTCLAEPNYEFRNDVTYYSDTCPVNIYLNLRNLSAFHLTTYYNLWGDPIVALYLTDQCNRDDKTFYIELPYTRENIEYETLLYDFNDDTEEFNLSMYDVQDNLFVQLRFKVEGNNLLVYNYPLNVETLIHNDTLYGSNLWVNVYTYIDPNRANNRYFNLILGNSTYGESIASNLTILQNITSNPELIGLTVGSGNFYQEWYRYLLIGSQLEWSTTKPTSFTRYRPFYENYPEVYTVYVSDEVHYDINEYRKINRVYYMRSCSYADEYTGDVGVTDVLGFFDNLMGGSLRQFVNISGIDLALKGILWLFYVGLILFMVVLEYSLIKRADIIFPLLISSAFIGLVSFFLNYWSHFITSLIGIAMSLALIIGKGLTR